MLNVQDAKTNFSSLLDRVAAGETIVVSRHNKPIAEIRPLPAPMPARQIGLLKGQIRWTENAFKPMDENELADFEGSRLFPVKTDAHSSGQ